MLPASADEKITDRKVLFTVSFLLVNALVWLFMTNKLMDVYVTGLGLIGMDLIILWGSYYSSMIVFGVLGAIFSKTVARSRFIFVWTLVGALVSLLPLIFVSPTFIELEFLTILFGAIVGVGMSPCLGYFADSTRIANRGLFSGVTFLCMNLLASVFYVVFDAVGDIFVSWIILAVWRCLGLLIFLKPVIDEKRGPAKTSNDSFKSIITSRPFYLYFAAWLMFMLIDRSEQPTLRFLLEDMDYYIVAPIIGSISGFGAGILADRIGRKKVIMSGFVIFGIGYALIGIDASNLIARYFFITMESIAGGILAVAFILILWGDLSEFSSREKYYAIGLTPLFLTLIIQLFSGPFFRNIENESAFSLASFFLFMALLPLWLAPETLPEKNIELRRLKNFAEQAKKAREKYETKN